jgi:hypothetical protein
MGAPLPRVEVTRPPAPAAVAPLPEPPPPPPTPEELNPPCDAGVHAIRCAAGLGARQIGLRNRQIVAEISKVQIVLKRQCDRVLQGDIKLAVSNEGLKPRGILQADWGRRAGAIGVERVARARQSHVKGLNWRGRRRIRRAQRLVLLGNGRWLRLWGRRRSIRRRLLPRLRRGTLRPAHREHREAKRDRDNARPHREWRCWPHDAVTSGTTPRLGLAVSFTIHPSRTSITRLP